MQPFQIKIDAKQKELEPWHDKINKKKRELDLAQGDKDELERRAKEHQESYDAASANFQQLQDTQAEHVRLAILRFYFFADSCVGQDLRGFEEPESVSTASTQKSGRQACSKPPRKIKFCHLSSLFDI